MAFLAQNFNVLSGERVIGFCMVKSGCWFPGDRGVAGCARGRELATVLVSMAACARGIQSKIRAGEVDLLSVEWRFVLNELHGMTGAAIERAVFTFEPVSGHRMIEILLALVPVDEFIVSSLMLDVTKLAFGIISASVQTEAGPVLRRYQFVAGIAFVG